MSIIKARCAGVALAWMTVALAGWPVADVRGDFFLATTNDMHRYSNSGQFLGSFGSIGEAVGGMAYGPDGLIYVVGNDFGIGYIYRFDPVTNTFLDDPNSSLAYAGGTLQYSHPGAMKFGPGGHLFAIGDEMDSEGLVPQQHVLRFDETGAILGALDGAIPNPWEPPYERFTDLAVRSNGDVYVAKVDGTIQRHVIGDSDEVLVDTMTTGVNLLASMVFGPDGLLYMREAVNNSILRYDVDTETVVDTFVPFVPFASPAPHGYFTGEIFFGPNGDLFAINSNDFLDPESNGSLVRLDGQDGSLVKVVATMEPSLIFDDGFNGFGLHVPIPEPNAMLIALVGIVMAIASRRSFSVLTDVGN